MLDGLESARVIVGLDFGTSRSGFAYAFTVDKRVVGWTAWPGQSSAYPKTLTQLVYGPDRKVIAWGYLAAQRLAELRRAGDVGDYQLFSNFKMALHEGDSEADRGPVLTRSSGEYPVIDLISDYLRLLREMAWNTIRETTAGLLREDEVAWCLTIPAIWTDREKQLMRFAAQNAGLVGSAGAERLLLVLEPEAAAIHCQEKDYHTLEPGTRFMVVDCGGGTVDITSHEIVPGQGMQEVVPGTGGALGSTYVDRIFIERFLESKLTPELLRAYREQEPLDFLETLADWERIKCHFDPQASAGASCLPFRPRLYRLLMERFPAIYDELVAQGHDDGIYIETDEMEAIFTPILDGIVEKVGEQLERMGSEGCELIFLVGGFSTSPLLKQRIRDAFAARIGKIVVPPVPGAAVVEGAVSFGLKPWLIRARRSRLTYGCDIQLPFDPARDSFNRRFWAADKRSWYCKNRFNAFVQAGDAIEFDQRVTRFFSPMTRDQTEIYFDFYASGKRDVRYVDEPQVEKIGEFRVEIPDTSGGLDREVELSMYFGKTEIEVKAVDRTTGQQCRTTLDFSTTFSPELIEENA